MAKATKKAAKKVKKAADTGALIDPDRVSSYTVSDVKTASGKRKSVDCNDGVASMLRGKSVEDLEKLAAKHGLSERFKGWEHLNAGMIRMNFGNVLRATLRAKEEKKASKKAA